MKIDEPTVDELARRLRWRDPLAVRRLWERLDPNPECTDGHSEGLPDLLTLQPLVEMARQHLRIVRKLRLLMRDPAIYETVLEFLDSENGADDVSSPD